MKYVGSLYEGDHDAEIKTFIIMYIIYGMVISRKIVDSRSDCDKTPHDGKHLFAVVV